MTEQTYPEARMESDQKLRAEAEKAGMEAELKEQELSNLQSQLTEAKETKEADEVNWQGRHDELAIKYAKKEKDLRVMRQELDQLKPMIEEYKAFQSALSDPSQRLKALEDRGVSYMTLTQDVVGAEQDQPTEEQRQIRALEQQVQALQQQNQLAIEQQQKAEEARKQAAVQEYTRKLVSDNQDKYPYLHALGRHDAVIAEFNRQVEALGPNPPSSAFPDEHAVAAMVESRFRDAVVAKTKTFAERGLLDDHLKEMGYVKRQAKKEERITDDRAAKSPLSGQPIQPQQTSVTLTNDMSATPETPFDHKAAYAKGDMVALRNHAAKVAAQAAQREEEAREQRGW